MAERTPYVPSRGRGLMNLAGPAVSNAPAQAFGQLSQVAESVQRSANNYFESKREETYNRSIIDANTKLMEYAAQYETQPENFESAASGFLKGKASEYAKHDQKYAERFLFTMQQEQRRLKLDVNKKYNRVEHERMAGETQSAVDAHTRMIGMLGTSDMSQLLRGMEALYAGVEKRGPDEQRVFDETQANTIKQNTVENWARILVSERVRQLPDDGDYTLADFRQEMIEGTATMPWAALDATTGKFVEMDQFVGALLPGENNRIINLIDSEMSSRRIKADAVGGREKYAADLAVNSYLAQVGMSGSDSVNTPPPSPDQLQASYGNDWQQKFDYDYAKVEAEGNVYRTGRDTPPHMRQQERSAVAPALWPVFDKAAEEIDALIESDPATGILSVDDVAAKSAEAFFQGKATPEQYAASLEQAYEHWGVSPEKRYLLTKPMLQSSLTKIDEPNDKGEEPTAAQRSNRIKAIAGAWGPQRDRVLAQIFDHGEVPAVYSALVDVESPVVSAQLSSAIDNADSLNKSLASTGRDTRDITKAIAADGRVGDFFRSMPMGDQDKAAGYAEAVNLLTKQFVLNGMSEKDAAAKAVDAVLPFEYAGVDRLVRVPKEEFTDTVSASLTPYQLRVTLDEIMPNVVLDDVYSASGAVSREVARQQFQDSLYLNARFVTNADGSGVNIVDSVIGAGHGNVLMVSDGKGRRIPWEKKWNELDVEPFDMNQQNTLQGFR